MGYPRAVHYAAALALTPVATPAAAAMSGDDMLRYCDSPKSSQPYAMCTGYIAGIAHGITAIAIFQDTQEPICEPATVDANQRVDIVLKWLRDNPKGRELPGVGLTIMALRDAFPCAKK